MGGHGGGRGGGGLRALPAGLPAEGEAVAGQSGGSVGGGCRERSLRGLPCRVVPFAGAVLREAVRLPAVPRRRGGAPAGPVPRDRGAVHPLPPSAEGGSGGVGRGRRHFGGGAAAMLERGGGFGPAPHGRFPGSSLIPGAAAGPAALRGLPQPLRRVLLRDLPPLRPRQEAVPLHRVRYLQVREGRAGPSGRALPLTPPGWGTERREPALG